ncbi:MAG: FAS1-like dehydratase domain-containing protein [Pseudomonadales bacterium]|jgi:hypothetical protein
MDADIQELRERFLNKSFDEKTFNIDPAVTTEYARLSGELSEKYLDTNHPDFQAPPTYLACLSGRRSMPEDFPRFGFGMDAGKGIECFAPVRPGQALVGRTHLHDIYTKTGRSGRMIFVVTRIEFYDEAGVHVANSDSRSVMREKKA